MSITITLTDKEAELIRHALSSRSAEMSDDAECEAENGDTDLVEECEELNRLGGLLTTNTGKAFETLEAIIYTLAVQDEWSGDELDLIAEILMDADYATIDDQGYFKGV